MSKKRENDVKQIRSSSFSVVDNFQSPILISNLAVATDVDRELVRSIAFFGESESFWDTLRRNPNFLYRLDSASKKVARDRRRYLLSVRANQPEKFEAFCKHYNIPFEVGSKNLSLEFNETIENTCESTNDNKKKHHFNESTMELAVKSFSKQSKYLKTSLICNINLFLIICFFCF